MLVAGSLDSFSALWPPVFPPTTDVMQQTAHQLIAASLHPVQMALPASADESFLCQKEIRVWWHLLCQEAVSRETPLFTPAAAWRLLDG